MNTVVVTRESRDAWKVVAFCKTNEVSQCEVMARLIVEYKLNMF